MAPADVVKAGAAAGLQFSRNLVYEVRARLENGPKRKGKKAARVTAKPTLRRRAAPKAARRGATRGPVAAASPSDERAFLIASLDVGLGRARELLGELEKRIESLVRS